MRQPQSQLPNQEKTSCVPFAYAYIIAVWALLVNQICRCFFATKVGIFQVFFRYFRNFFMSPYRANIVASLLPYKTKVGVLYICRKYGQVSFLFNKIKSAGPGKTCLVFPLTGSGNSNDQDSISNSLMTTTPSGLNLNPESGRKSCHHDRMADSSVMS